MRGLRKRFTVRWMMVAVAIVGILLTLVNIVISVKKGKTAGNDPWRRRTDRQRKKGTYPKPKPHRIRFTRRQEPAFQQLAHQIGMDR